MTKLSYKLPDALMKPYWSPLDDIENWINRNIHVRTCLNCEDEFLFKYIKNLYLACVSRQLKAITVFFYIEITVSNWKMLCIMST